MILTQQKTQRLSAREPAKMPAIVETNPLVNGGHGDDGEHALAFLRAELALAPDATPEDALHAARQNVVDLTMSARRRHLSARMRRALRDGNLVKAFRVRAEELIAEEDDLFNEWLLAEPTVSSTPSTGDVSPESLWQALTSLMRVKFQAQQGLGRLTTEEEYLAVALRHGRHGVSRPAMKLASRASLAPRERREAVA